MVSPDKRPSPAPHLELFCGGQQPLSGVGNLASYLLLGCVGQIPELRSAGLLAEVTAPLSPPQKLPRFHPALEGRIPTGMLQAGCCWPPAQGSPELLQS